VKIGILALGRPTFDVQYAKERLTTSLKFLSSTNHNIFGSCELLLNEKDALQEINKLRKENLDFVIIIQVTFTDSSTILKIATCLEKQIGIWAFPEPRLGGRLRLNAFCGLNLASHTLGLNNIPFSWIYENPENMNDTKFEILINSNNSKRPKKILEIPSLGSKKAKSVKEKIHNLKIGKIGTHPDGFDTCKYDQKKLFGLCGITVDEIDIEKFLNNSKNIKSEEIEPTLNKLKKTISSIREVNQKELILSLKLEKSLKKLKEDGTYNAFAIRCWPEMFTEYGGAICAPASMLTENKVPCACEADVYGAVTQLILQEVSGQSVFLTDIVDIDLDDNSGVFWHCGQAPISMCNPKIKPTATIHSNRKMPLLFEFPLKEGIVTMMRISQSFGEQKMVVSKGKMIDRPLPFTGTSGVINFDNDTKDVLNKIISYGLEHHIAITYGDHVELLSEVASELKLPILYI
jgi:L-fucose isomerase-like protein